MAKKQQETQQDTQGSVETTQDEPTVVPGLWIAEGGGYELKVKADTRELAVALVKAYTQLEEQGFVLSQAKVKAGLGERVLRGRVTEAGVEYQLS